MLPATTSPRQHEPGNLAIGPAPAQAVRVLIIDDDPNVRDSLRWFLTLKAGAACMVGAAGPGMLDGVSGWHPTAAVINPTLTPPLPELPDGYALIRELRRCEPDLRIVAYTNQAAAATVKDMPEVDAVIIRGAHALSALIDEVTAAPHRDGAA